MLRSGSRRSSPVSLALLGLLAAALAFVVVVQVRSEAEVERSPSGRDSTTLAFLIDDLHSANDALAAEVDRSQTQQDSLRHASAGGAAAEISTELKQIEVLEGLAPARGPGIVISIDANLQAIDLQDALNNLRISGAEALTVNGQRVVTSTPIYDQAGRVIVGTRPQKSPWTFVAIGDPQQLAAAADLMTRTLQSDPRVRLATWRSDADVTISAVLTQRPLVYGTPG